ncbi:LPXTG cell wall anchor domain-containing protein [Streptococcus australis]|uniref:LPXTG-motif cell wall anchor domain protein n=1 Tax=Streptococcus australis ATCC 700641 TaxID=888833 RepID=E7S9M8_9STRE|nr:LPXTG cell wall anchor domain-containing protein [Streptococcus australis]EFV99753.1 LPXTG-motif cell wall anchor domain protein [Streptococcus australis ATCC 700641]EGU65874.1 LPXTG-motif cell wall anchor domain protein [Streptococcus australis ATCC 700641]
MKTIAVSYHTGASVKEEPSSPLPKTGQDELVTHLLSLYGMTSLALAGIFVSKKREEN